MSSVAVELPGLWLPPKREVITSRSPWWRLPSRLKTASRAEVLATIGTPAQVAVGSSTSNNATVTTAASGGAVAAGSLIILLATARVASTITCTFSASGGGLSYTTELNGNASASNGVAAIGYALNPSGLSSGLTWTATFSASATRKRLTVYSVSGLAASSPADSTIHTGTNNPKGAGSGAVSIGGDATCAQADTIFFALVKHNTTAGTDSGTPGTGWTELDDIVIGSSTFMQHYSAYRIVSSAENPSWAPTLTVTSTNWNAGIAAFKMAAAGGVTAIGPPVGASVV